MLETYLWLHKKYSDQVNQMLALPVDHPYFDENPEFLDYFQSFDLMTGLVEKARSIVAAEGEKHSAAKRVADIAT